MSLFLAGLEFNAGLYFRHSHSLYMALWLSLGRSLSDLIL